MYPTSIVEANGSKEEPLGCLQATAVYKFYFKYILSETSKTHLQVSDFVYLTAW